MVRLSALLNGRLYPPGDTSRTHFCYSLSRSQAHSAAGWIKSIKILIAPSGIESVALWLVNQYVNQLGHHVSTKNYNFMIPKLFDNEQLHTINKYGLTLGTAH